MVPLFSASPGSRAGALLVTGALLVSAVSLSAPTSAATGTPPEVALSEPLNGQEAVAGLGADLEAAAALNGRDPDEMRDLLLDDPTTWIDSEARLLVKDPLDPHVDTNDHPRTAPRTATLEATAEPPAPYADTFRLHSLPGSQRTIFLDFDGADLTHTHWDTWEGVKGTYGGWDPAGNGTTFTDDELLLVQQVWATVAEDYAPYDVNVTTQDPGRAALARSGPTDDVYGARVLFSDSDTLFQKVGGGSTVGVAYLGIFDEVIGNAPVAPALVLTSRLPADPALVGDVASHEVGHTLDLDHVDGLPGTPPTTDLYGPIMQGYITHAAVTQWTAPDTTQIPRGGLALREDEAGGTRDTAVPLPAPAIDGVVSSATDEDWWTLTHCTDMTATVTPAPYSPNLDVVLRLVDAQGTTVTTDAPATTVTNGVVSGLGARISRTLTGVHHLVVTGGGDGVGGTTVDYDATGSLGAYTLEVTGCEHHATPPGPPRAVEAVTTDAGRTTVTWKPPMFSGGSPVTGYRITLDDAVVATAPATALSHTLDTGTGRQRLSVSAINDVGSSAPATTRSVTTPNAVAHVSLLRAPARHRTHPHDRLLRWSGVDDGGSPVTALDLRRGSPNGARLLEREEVTNWVAHISTQREGQKYFFRLHNAVGPGQWKQFTLHLTARTPAAPRDLSVRHDPSTRQLSLAWAAPRDDGGAPLTGHRVRVGAGAWRVLEPGTTSLTLDGVDATGQTVRVAATNRLGGGAVARAAVVPDGARKPGQGRVRAVTPGRAGGKRTVVVRWRPGRSHLLPTTRHRLVVQRFDNRGKLVSTTRTTAYGPKRRKAQLTRAKAGTYRFAVQSGNALGWGPRSAYSRKIRPR